MMSENKIAKKIKDGIDQIAVKTHSLLMINILQIPS